MTRLAVFVALLLLAVPACSSDDGGGAAAGGGAGKAGSSSSLPTAGTGGGVSAGGADAGGSPGTAGAPPLSGGAAGEAGSPPAPVGGASSGGPTCEATSHQGEGTYYAADGSGNCSFEKGPDVLIGAMNKADYAASASCGACIALKGPLGGPIRVRIVDQCPECKPGDVDLHPGAFDQIAKHEAGRVPISWTYVSCDGAGPISYHFKDGSNPYWTAVQIRNHANAIAKVEYKAKDGSYREMKRQSYNYFLEDKGLGSTPPYTLRVTDVFGNVVEDGALPSIEEGTHVGSGQFPVCTP